MARTRQRTRAGSTGRRGGAVRAGALLPDIARRALRQQGFAQAEVVTRWPEIVGLNLAEATAPLKLSFARGARRDGTLHVRVTPAAALELQHQAPVVIDRINGYYGYRAVARLALTQGPVAGAHRAAPPAAAKGDDTAPDEAARQGLETTLRGLQDTALKEALSRLGSHVLTRRRRAARPK